MEKPSIFVKIGAEAGLPQAQLVMAKYYYDVADYEQFIFWSERAAKQGEIVAILDLGFVHSIDENYPLDYSEAFRWFSLAAEKGNGKAFRALGCMYNNGYYVERDYQKAIEWYEKAAELGDDEAISLIGSFYEYGFGEEPDLERAFEYYNKIAVPTYKDEQKRYSLGRRLGRVERDEEYERDWALSDDDVFLPDSETLYYNCKDYFLQRDEGIECSVYDGTEEFFDEDRYDPNTGMPIDYNGDDWSDAYEGDPDARWNTD